MSLLVDTHIVLWWLNGDPTLPEEITERLNHEPDAYLSAASVWEVAIKQAVGKLEGPGDLPERVRDCGLIPLAIDHDHSIAAGRLPMIHRDPFDRMLIAQAKCEELTLITRDAFCLKYEVETLTF